MCVYAASRISSTPRYGKAPTLQNAGYLFRVFYDFGFNKFGQHQESSLLIFNATFVA